MAPAGTPLLAAEDLRKSFGGVNALSGYHLRVEAGELLGLIGPNGAGKTTACNLLTGVLRPSGGTIRFAGREVTGLPAHRFAALGIARTFQNIRLFSAMTVRENVMAATRGYKAVTGEISYTRANMVPPKPVAIGGVQGGTFTLLQTWISQWLAL